VQLRPDCAPTSIEDILAFCRRRLSSQKVPSSLDLVADIPLTSSGKVRHG
jgi:acyl-CoA synthetase (AMP-forming)/AMP-acid ligase II